jgi:hypothetical protein
MARRRERKMLGDEIGTFTGQTTGQRVLPDEGQGMVVESSFEADGQMLEIPIHQLGTYQAIVRPDGTLAGEGRGVVMSPQGDAASWTAHGVGTFTEDGGVAYRGSAVYETQSERFAPLARVLGVFEFEAGPDGSVKGTVWEWK